MNSLYTKQLANVLPHLYINPLERCNLRCKICYTKKTAPILSPSEIHTFIQRYEEVQKLQTVTFCGGEVFTLPYLSSVVNDLTDRGIFVQIITNGTIDRLDEFKRENFINVIVSIDGVKTYHDSNRGIGMFDTSIKFLHQAIEKGFHTEIFSIVTKQNYDCIDMFEAYLHDHFREPMTVTYHPRKPPLYLMHHPTSNIVGTTDGFDYLDEAHMRELWNKRKTFPPKELGCYQIALVSDGRVFGCCEGVTPIGTLSDPIETLVHQLTIRIQQWENENPRSRCLGCSSPDFVCGIKLLLQSVEPNIISR